jgi:hypothetical protein
MTNVCMVHYEMQVCVCVCARVDTLFLLIGGELQTFSSLQRSAHVGVHHW